MKIVAVMRRKYQRYRGRVVKPTTGYDDDNGLGSIAGKERENSPDNSESDDGNSEKTDSKTLSANSVKLFLKEHPGFLEKYIMEEVDLEQLERWMIRRTQRSRKTTQSLTRNNRKTSLSTWKFCVHADKRQMLLDLTHSLQLSPPKDHVLIELANCISSAVNANGFTLYIAEPCCSPDSLSIYCGQTAKYHKAKQPDDSIALYVAKTKESIRLSREIVDPRFPNGICKKDDIDHILCQAITQPDGQLVAVLELHRSEEGFPFHEEDEEISSSYLVWGGIALHYAHLFVNMSKQRKLNEFLLAVVKSIFQDMVSMETLITKIIKFAQRLVDADRASLFLVDSKSQELYATIFDVGNEESDTKSGVGSDDDSNKTKDEIRFPIGTGIAGIVALNGENLNIHDVYADPRFNRSVDQKTGYKTENILCMPIFNRGSIIGVVQMINKRSGHFVKEDEEAFEMFAIYCGLALHHSKLYNQIRRSQQKFKVALEVLSYHNSSTDEEVQQILADQTSDIVPHLDEFYFDPFAYEDLKKVKFATHMFVDLFGLKRFDRTNLIRFALTVKKNYRRVPYHNWNHGFSVANTIYTIIKQTGNLFRPIEGLALYIASLCHDLDHRGKNNKFMLEMGSPLAAIYSTSTMEHHHFNQTVTILQQEGHNIFAKLSNVEYKLVLSLIKHCILATDLEQFFPCKAKLTALIDEEKFTWSSQEHRLMIQAITMTAGDLSASAKPWDIQEKTVKVIFQEFYDQGDAERAAGLIPIPMMDRKKPEEQANSQVSFLTGICIPCYSLLYRFIPETKPLLDRCQENLSRWQEKANKTNK